MPSNINRKHKPINRNLRQKPSIFSFETSTNAPLHLRKKRRAKSPSTRRVENNFLIVSSTHPNEPKLSLNISGTRMQIAERLLNKFPNSLLGTESKRLPFYDKYKNEYFFDRSSRAFEGILFFYQSNGRFVLPEFVHVEVFYDEIKYFGLVDYLTDDSKCDESILYTSYLDLFNQIEESNSEDKNKSKVTLRKRFHRIKAFSANNENDDADDENDLPKNEHQRKLFFLIERPNRTLFGKMLMFFFLLAVIVSIVVMCLETIVVAELKLSFNGCNL